MSKQCECDRDKALSTAARKKLKGSSFCGPGRLN